MYNKLNKFNFEKLCLFSSYWIVCLALLWGHCLILLHSVLSNFDVVFWWPAHFFLKEIKGTWIWGRMAVCVERTGRYRRKNWLGCIVCEKSVCSVFLMYVYVQSRSSFKIEGEGSITLVANHCAYITGVYSFNHSYLRIYQLSELQL